MITASPEQIALTLWHLRIERRWTQKQLAGISGVGEKTISSYERDRKRCLGLSLMNLILIAGAFDIRPSELLAMAERTPLPTPYNSDVRAQNNVRRFHP